MKYNKITLGQLANVELDELELCNALGGESGNCQCGCHYAGSGGGSSSPTNYSANDEGGLKSDPSCPPPQNNCSCPPPPQPICDCPTQFSDCFSPCHDPWVVESVCSP